MPVTGREVLGALDAAVRTWGGRRRAPVGADLIGPESLAGAVLDQLGLADLVPHTTMPRRALADVPDRYPLAQALSGDAARLLAVVCELDRAGRNWSFIRGRARALAAEIAVHREAS